MNRCDVIAGSIAILCILALFNIYKCLSNKTLLIPESKCYDVYIAEKCTIVSANANSGQLSVTCFFKGTNTYSTFVQPVGHTGAAWFQYHPTKDFGSMIVREMTD